MRSCLFTGLLLFFVTAFFGLEPFATHVLGATDLRIMGFSLLGPEFKIILGLGIVFCELLIIVFSNSIVLTVIEALKVVPLMFFVMAMYKTFWPLISGLIPTEGSETFKSQNDAYLAQAVNNDGFREGVLLTLVTMLFFVIINQAFGKIQRPKRRLVEYKE